MLNAIKALCKRSLLKPPNYLAIVCTIKCRITNERSSLQTALSVDQYAILFKFTSRTSLE